RRGGSCQVTTCNLPDDRLDYVLKAFTWRITASSSPWELAQVVEACETYDDWCRAWSAWGARHEAFGDAAATSETAGDAYVRAAAARAVDAHGQGSSSLRSDMAPPFEPPVRAILDRFAGDFDSVVVGGLSYGGTFALRAAAVDPRVRACFAVSSGYSAAGRYE